MAKTIKPTFGLVLELYFGSMLLIKHCYDDLTNETAEDFDLEEWNKLYEKLFGGFEELGDDDSYSEEEDIPSHLQTKQGYSKEDGFVVSDGDEEDEEYIPDEEEEEDDIETTDDAEEDGMGQESDIEEEEEEEDDEEDDYEDEEYDSDIGSELSEESYIDTDDD